MLCWVGSKPARTNYRPNTPRAEFFALPGGLIYLGRYILRISAVLSSTFLKAPQPTGHPSEKAMRWVSPGRIGWLASVRPDRLNPSKAGEPPRRLREAKITPLAKWISGFNEETDLGHMTAVLAANRHRRTVNGKLRAVVGWSTGLEPATAGTTIQGSTIELRPPFPKGVLEYLNFGVRQADFRSDHSPLDFRRRVLPYQLLCQSQT
jgi:hypothetical protein